MAPHNAHTEAILSGPSTHLRLLVPFLFPPQIPPLSPSPSLQSSKLSSVFGRGQQAVCQASGLNMSNLPSKMHLPGEREHLPVSLVGPRPALTLSRAQEEEGQSKVCSQIRREPSPPSSSPPSHKGRGLCRAESALFFSSSLTVAWRLTAAFLA